MYRERLYRAAEARRILSRAAELCEGEPPAEGDAAPPRTLAEIEELGRHLGIPKALVERAAGERASGARGNAARVSPWTGGPSRILLEERLPGRFTAADHARIARLIRRTTGDVGNPQALGDAFSWTSRLPARPLAVNVEPDEDGIYLRIEESLQPLRGQIFGGLLGGLGGGGLGLVVPLSAELGPRVMPVVAIVWCLLVYFLARRLYAGRAGKREREAHTLLAALCDELASSGATPAPWTAADDAAEGVHVRVADAATSGPAAPSAEPLSPADLAESTGAAVADEEAAAAEAEAAAERPGRAAARARDRAPR